MTLGRALKEEQRCVVLTPPSAGVQTDAGGQVSSNGATPPQDERLHIVCVYNLEKAGSTNAGIFDAQNYTSPPCYLPVSPAAIYIS